MTPAKRLQIIRVITNLAKHKKAMDEFRGRTVPPIREGGTWDGRHVRFADLPLADQEMMQAAYDAGRELLGTREWGDEEDMLEQRQFERDLGEGQ